jgi:DNA repair protein RecN (Recombination protein N)
MLASLRISNLAVIDELQIEFGRGLNVLSGETGSGKSIIIDAVALLLGGKSSTDMIRTGQEKASVEGTFDIAGNAPLLTVLSSAGIDADQGDLIIRRELQITGRSRIFINNQSATASLLREIQPHLLDIHGQGEQQSLLSAQVQLKTFDGFAGTVTLREKTEAVLASLRKNLTEYERLDASEGESRRMIELLKFQIDEISRAAISVNEDLELESERKVLINAEKIVEVAISIYKDLYDKDSSASELLAASERKLGDLINLDTSLNEIIDKVKEVQYYLEDIVFFIRKYINNIQISPERLRQIDDRLDEIYRIKKKYGKQISDLQVFIEDLQSQLAQLDSREDQRQQYWEGLCCDVDVYLRHSEDLSARRKGATKKFKAAILSELKEVALEKADFEVILITNNDSEEASRIQQILSDNGGQVTLNWRGREHAEFYFSANPGESLKPIRLVASGGEVSRLMLVLKTIIAPTNFPRTLIFDEIDTGIGGRVADAVGQRLKKLAKTNQVFCVTHQAQTARYADVHFSVSKITDKSRTRTQVSRLSAAQRVDELARMIGGQSITSAARKHAQELLKI